MAGEGNVGDGQVDAGAGASGAGGGAASGSAASGAAGGSGNPNPVTKWEDTPQYKAMVADLQKERKARQDLDGRSKQFEAELVAERRRVAALAGVEPRSKAEEADEAVRQRFKELYPHLADLTAEDIQAIRESRGESETTKEFMTQQWTNHHKSMIGELHREISKELGDLNERQIKRVNAAYVAQCEQDPEFMRKVEMGDKAAVLQFAKEYLEDLVVPIRRKVNAEDAGRFRPVPGGKDRSLPMKGDKPIDVKDDKAVMDFLVSSRQGQFGRR